MATLAERITALAQAVGADVKAFATSLAGVQSALNAKFDKAGGTISGPTVINNSATQRPLTIKTSGTGDGRVVLIEHTDITQAIGCLIKIGDVQTVVNANGTGYIFTPQFTGKSVLEGVGNSLALSAQGAESNLEFYTENRTLAGRVTPKGSLLLTRSAFGYGPGAGGTVVQPTSKSTAVTLNKPCGMITMNASALAAGATVQFEFNNTSLVGEDLLLLAIQGWTANYEIRYEVAASGLVRVYVKNTSDASRSDPLPIKFAVIKGATT